MLSCLIVSPYIPVLIPVCRCAIRHADRLVNVKDSLTAILLLKKEKRQNKYTAKNGLSDNLRGPIDKTYVLRHNQARTKCAMIRAYDVR